jgi:hypothetical protein
MMAARVEAEKNLKQAEIARDQEAQNLEARRKAADANAAVVNGIRAKDVWDLVDIDQPTRNALQKELAEVGVSAAISSNEELRKTLDDLRGVGTHVKLLATSVVRQPRILLLLLVLLVLAPFGVGAAIKLMQAFQPSLAWVLGLFVAYAGTVTKFLAKHLKTAKQILDRIDSVRRTLDKKILAAEAARHTEITTAEAALATAAADVTAARGALETQEHQVTAAKQALLELTNGYRLTRFIDERAASDDYRKLLGVLATVRTDFSTLSELMYPADGKSDLSDDLRIDRIILYIDDLDRCDPDRVVDVLQAVHLLLAFKLFVVVVGVDARWVSESLRQKHRALRGKRSDTDAGDDVPGYAVAPHDYLEKIFQVPFWLDPLKAETTKSYIGNLLAGDVVHPGELPTRVNTTVLQGGGVAYPQPQPQPQWFVRSTIGESVGAETDPKQLTIDEKELVFMTGDVIAPLVSRSPRTAKRYVNTYRFLRASLPSDSMTSYLADAQPPEYRCALLLLAIVVGAPDVSLEVLRQMKGNKTVKVKAFADSVERDAEHAEQWEAVVTALNAFEHGSAPLAQLVEQIPRIERYSFRAPFAPVPGKKQIESKDPLIPIAASRSRKARPTI